MRVREGTEKEGYEPGRVDFCDLGSWEAEAEDYKKVKANLGYMVHLPQKEVLKEENKREKLEELKDGIVWGFSLSLSTPLP